MKDDFDITKITKRIISNIKKLRELIGITREQIADELELSASGYSKLERGEIELSVIRLLQISKILNVQFEDLINLEIGPEFQYQTIEKTEQIKNSNSNIYLEKYVKLLEKENESLKNKLDEK